MRGESSGTHSYERGTSPVFCRGKLGEGGERKRKGEERGRGGEGKGRRRGKGRGRRGHTLYKMLYRMHYTYMQC